MSEAREGATSAQLKDDINSGRTGDKIAGFDPAAAPLGTDEEAGGAPLEPRVIEHARRQEQAGKPNSATKNAATPELTPSGLAPPKQNMAMPVLLGVIGAVVLLVLLLMLVR